MFFCRQTVKWLSDRDAAFIYNPKKLSMLKWLQSGVYHTASNNVDIITDDPLATLNFKDDDAKKPPSKLFEVKGSQQKEIYSVSR